MLSQQSLRALIVLVASSVFLSGCAATPKIGYKVDSARQASKNVEIKIEKFVDNRTGREQGVIGGVYNGYGMRMGDVHEPANLIQSLEDAFKAELENSGYTMSQESRDLIIQGFIEAISCEIANAQNSTFVVRIRATDKSEEVLNNTYQGKKSIFMTFDTSCSDALNAAMKDLIKKFVKDLDDYIKS